MPTSGRPQKQQELLANVAADQTRPGRAGTGPDRATVTKQNMVIWENMEMSSIRFLELDRPPRTKRPRPVSTPRVPLDVKLPEGDRWVKESDFTGSSSVAGRVRARFGAAVSAFDADGDGKLDLYLASAVGGAERHSRRAACSTRVTAGSRMRRLHSGCPGIAPAWVSPRPISTQTGTSIFFSPASATIACLRNVEGKKFEDISSTAEADGAPAVSLMARWLDLDQDGDLDLYVVNYCAAAHAEKAFIGAGDPPPGLANVVYRNDGVPDAGSAATIQGRAPARDGLRAAPSKKGCRSPWYPGRGSNRCWAVRGPTRGSPLLDIDNDRDLDLVLTAEKSSPVALLNDRLGVFHEAPIEGIRPRETASRGS